MSRNNDVVREYYSALQATRMVADLAPLRAAGVSVDALAAALPALATITVNGGIYQPDPESGAAFLLPVRIDNALTPEAPDPLTTVRHGALVDLVAMHPAHPGRWALRVGIANWLGAIEPQFCDPFPVRIWRTPLAWLRAGCRGLVILSSDPAAAYRVLSTCRNGIIAEDRAHAAELRRALERALPFPTITTSRMEAAHVA